MPTYKEALKKLKVQKAKPKSRKKARPTRHKPKVSRRAKKPAKKVVRRIVRKKPIRKKPIKKKLIKKIKPKKKKVIKKSKPQKKAIKKRVVKRRKPLKRKKPVRKKRKKKLAKPRVYIGKGTLEQLFESQAKVKLLKFFFRNAGNMFRLRDIFKQLRINAALLRQEMKKIENAGLIKQKKTWLIFRKKKGRIKKEKKIVWYLNPGFEFIKELGNLVLKSTIASKDDLAIKARKLGNIKLLALSGIFMGNSTSRADLLIVGDKINHRKLNNFIKDIEAEVGKELRCAVMTNKEFNYRYDMYDRFIRDLLTDNCEILIKKVNLW